MISEKKDYYAFFNINTEFEVLSNLNNFMYYSINLIIQVGMLFMLYKIRWINDDTLITKECMIVVFVWVLSTQVHLLV